MVTDIIDGIDLVPPVTELVEGAGGILASLVPVGVGLLLVLAVPRLIRKLIGAFI
jgi:hypothetical protein